MSEPVQHREGAARFQVGPAFYRPQSRLSRDLGVLAAIAQKADTGRLHVLDAMAGCGVRTLRYALEGGADGVWANDSNPDVGPVLHQNLANQLGQNLDQSMDWSAEPALPAIAPTPYRITQMDANQVFFTCYSQREFYDLVDVDCFGSPTPYLGTSLWAVALGGLLYLTSTDGRSATGHSPQVSLGVYGAYSRVHPAAHEQGLRLMLGALLQQASTKGRGIEPLFSLFSGQIYRVLIRLVAAPTLTPDNYGFLGYCHTCGDYQVISWRRLGRVACPQDGHPLALSGPLWLGPLHDPGYVARLADLALHRGWGDRAQLLRLMAAEALLPPYFYPLGEIGRRGQMDSPGRSPLVEQLHQWGYAASPTHINAQAIKTTADLKTCIEAARAVSTQQAP